MAVNHKSYTQKKSVGVKRREVLASGSALVAASAMTACAPLRQAGQIGAQEAGAESLPAATATPNGWNMPFAEPEATYSDDESKALVADLNVEFADITIEEPGPGDTTVERIETSRTYNGQVPGPTFRANPGDKLEFKVINKLPPNEPAPPPFDTIADCHHLMSKNVPSCFNTTNLHTHGLHVSPTTKPNPDRQRGISSDDVHVRIPPYNDTMDDTSWPSERPYCIWLPEFHAPGTHWYHAHVHGSTALQVVNGLAGALIVEEPDDQKIDVDQELIWIIQEIIGDAQTVYGNIRDPDTGMTPYGGSPPTVSFTVNSLTSSTVTLRPNEIQRWRFINATATPRGFMRVGLFDDDDNLVEGALHLIAVDGITFYGKSPQPVVDPGHFLAPANRADFLVKIATPGRYRVMKRPAPEVSTGGAPTREDLLAVIDVSGDPMDDRPLPALPSIDKAPCYLNPITDDELTNNARRTFTFHFQQGQQVFGGHTINGQSYGRLDQDGNPKEAPNTCVPLGDAEEWTLLNTSPAAHPFHIHVNPFQVVGDKIDPDGPDDPSNWRWWDTISIPPGTPDNPGSVTIRSRFLTYHGKFVIHCHILVHEDIGMMQDLTVEGDGVDPCEPVYECKLTGY